MPKLPRAHPDTPSFDELRVGLRGLTPESQPRWGTMDAAAMLEHNVRFLDLYLGRERVGVGLRFAARILGPPFLRRLLKKSPTQTPRDLRTLGGLRVESRGSAEFEARRARFSEALDAVAALEGEVQHVLYGRMDAVAVQDLVRHHTAHHFHQFGLLEPR